MLVSIGSIVSGLMQCGIRFNNIPLEEGHEGLEVFLDDGECRGRYVGGLVVGGSGLCGEGKFKSLKVTNVVLIPFGDFGLPYWSNDSREV